MDNLIEAIIASAVISALIIIIITTHHDIIPATTIEQAQSLCADNDGLKHIIVDNRHIVCNNEAVFKYEAPQQ